jgi:hypothetical protein
MDGGQAWDIVPGSSQIPNITSFSFGHVLTTVLIPQPILVSSYGRGLWELSLPPSTSLASSATSALSARQSAPAALHPAIQEAQQIVAAPYLQLVGTVPIRGLTTALSGDEISAYGTGFCPVLTVGRCSPVVLQVGDRVAVEQVPVANDGTFRITFTVTESPGYYTVTASQTDSGGSTLIDSARLIVTIGDVEEVVAR